MTFEEVKEKLLADEDVRKEYEALNEEYEIIKASIEANKVEANTED